MSLVVVHQSRTITIALTVAVVHTRGPLANRVAVPVSVDPPTDLPIVLSRLRLHLPTIGADIAVDTWHAVPGGTVLSFAGVGASAVKELDGHIEVRWEASEESRAAVPCIVV